MKLINISSRLAVLAVIVLMATSCATTTSSSSHGIEIPPEGAIHNQSLYATNSLDGRGRPIFTDRLKVRPQKPGSDFFIVENNSQGQPLRYYHIWIKDMGPDYSRPMSTFKSRTGEGFAGGVEFADGILTTSSPNDGEEALAVLAVAAGSVVVGTLGGATVGLMQGTYETIMETSKALFSSQEELLSFSICEYDRHSRLKTLRAFETGPTLKEIFRVIYSYDRDITTPSKIYIVDIN